MPTHTNRLAREKSPYLLQHAHNPVDWYPWGEEAFEKARREDKPVILSIGYSTCHWCHVMEDESFSNDQVAAVMNRDFVAIKVDREERPDIDHVYMAYVMATTGSGGWPMNVFLTPDKKPFYGGTYFPPENRYGRPGWPSLLASIAEAWKDRRQEIAASADSAVRFLAEPAVSSKGSAAGDWLKEAAHSYQTSFDDEWAGFGHAPKFPRSHALSMLLRYWRRSGDARTLEVVERTLAAMAAGGMCDQLGGGFHRYSTDARWRVPHFEKMLYDQALLSRTYVEAYQATGKILYARIARQALDYVLREMTSPEGGFYSAQDADSVDPQDPARKREGAFYVWTRQEVERLLGTAAGAFCEYYGVVEDGNAISDPQGEFRGQNVLYVRPGDEMTEPVALAGKKMLEARSGRPRPHLDDKVLADWNGLMIDAFAFAGRVLEEPRYTEAASTAGRFVMNRMKRPDGRLWHRWRDGEAGIPANLNDAAFWIYGCLSLYESTFDVKWLEEARSQADRMIRDFRDETSGGFFLTASDAEALILRPKELYDGAIPAGSSVAALDLVILGHVTGDERYDRIAQDLMDSASGTVSQGAANYSQFLIATDLAAGPVREIVIAAAPGDAEAVRMVREVNRRFLPEKVLIFRPLNDAAPIGSVAPFLKDLVPADGRTTAYVCRNRVCSLPAHSARELAQRLDEK